MSAQTPIRTDVPITIHPDSLAGLGRTLDKENTLGVNAYSAAREALKLCYDSYALLNDAEKALKDAQPINNKNRSSKDLRMVDGTPTLVPNSKEFVASAEQAWARIAPAIDRRVKELTGIQTVLWKRVAEALDDPHRKTPEGLSLAAEVRAHVKALPHEERMQFAMNAINEGDKSTVTALLHAQPFLSGLDAKAHATMRQQAAAKFAPSDSAQYEATVAAVDRVMQAGSSLSARYSKVMRLKDSPQAKAAEQMKKLAGG
jgi:hypothetical protein